MATLVFTKSFFAQIKSESRRLSGDAREKHGSKIASKIEPILILDTSPF